MFLVTMLHWHWPLTQDQAMVQVTEGTDHLVSLSTCSPDNTPAAAFSVTRQSEQNLFSRDETTPRVLISLVSRTLTSELRSSDVCPSWGQSNCFRQAWLQNITRDLLSAAVLVHSGLGVHAEDLHAPWQCHYWVQRSRTAIAGGNATSPRSRPAFYCSLPRIELAQL